MKKSISPASPPACSSSPPAGATRTRASDTNAERQHRRPADAADADDTDEADFGRPPSGVQGEAADSRDRRRERGGHRTRRGLRERPRLAAVRRGRAGDRRRRGRRRSPRSAPREPPSRAQLPACADNDEIIDAFIDQMQTSGQEFDEECVREGLAGHRPGRTRRAVDRSGEAARGSDQRRVRLLRTRQLTRPDTSRTPNRHTGRHPSTRSGREP